MSRRWRNSPVSHLVEPVISAFSAFTTTTSSPPRSRFAITLEKRPTICPLASTTAIESPQNLDVRALRVLPRELDDRKGLASRCGDLLACGLRGPEGPHGHRECQGSAGEKDPRDRDRRILRRMAGERLEGPKRNWPEVNLSRLARHAAKNSAVAVPGVSS